MQPVLALLASHKHKESNMGQFKPMVKMKTTEPTVELKLAKGGAVKMKKGGSAKKMADGGGALNALAGTPALIGRPAVNAPVRAPGKPSMAMRRKAMMAKPAMTPSGPPMAMPPMKKGGKAEKHDDAAQDRSMIKKAMAGKKFATGGVVNGQGGYKDGGEVYSKGIIPESVSAKGGEGYKNTKMHTATPDHSPAKTGGVKNGNGGGYATGGVAKSNGGGYKHGGKSSKKAYATGGTVDTGKPVAMPQGRKPVPSSVKISQLAGTYKSGGRATPAESRLLKNNAAENSTAMREAKTDSNLKYGSPKRFKEGGSGTQDLSKGAYDKTGKYNRELEDAMNPLSMVKELAGKARDYFMPKSADSVTKTKESVTVTPAGKKRGGRAC